MTWHKTRLVEESGENKGLTKCLFAIKQDSRPHTQDRVIKFTDTVANVTFVGAQYCNKFKGLPCLSSTQN